MIGSTRSVPCGVAVALWLAILWPLWPLHGQRVCALDDPPPADAARGGAPAPEPVVTAPRQIAGADPSYPEAARSTDAGTPPAGAVRLRLSVNEQGEVTEAEVLESPAAALSTAAIEASRTLRFEPATRDGQPVAARVVFQYLFDPGASDPQPEEPPPSAAEPAVPTPQPPAAKSERPLIEMQATDVVVTGNRAPEQLKQAVVFTDVIGRQAIRESGARDASEALEHIPSLQLTRTFRGTEILLRGLDSEYTLVLLDGDRMIGRSGGAIDLTRIGVERIDRIEIVRGPSSALYGSDALAGVVNIIGRQNSGQAHGRGLLSGGFTPGTDAPMLDATLWATQPVAKGLDVQASAGVHSAPRVVDDGSDVTNISGRNQWSLFGSARYQPNQAHDVKVAGEYDRQRWTGVDEGAGTALYDRTQVREQGAVSVAYRVRPTETLDWNTRYRGSYFRDQYLRDQRGSSAMDSVEDNRESLHQATSMLTWQPEIENASTLGVEQQLQHLQAPRLTRTGERNVTSVFGQHRFRPWNVEHPERMECDQQLSIVPGVRFDADSQFGRQLSPKLAVRYDPVPCMTVRASYGRGFRAPSFQQLYLRFDNPTVGYSVLGNPNLGAERSHGFDFSVSYTPEPRVSAFIALFRNDVRDMIATVTEENSAAGTLFSYANIARAWTMGVELTAHMEPTTWLSWDLSYTFTNAWDAVLDRPLENIARHRPTTMLRFHRDDWGTSARFRGSVQIGRVYFGDSTELVTEAANERRIDADALVTGDIRVEQDLGEYLQVFVGVDNLASASDTYTTLRPRTFYLGVSGDY
jgi:outer membrane receptor for ferrienterochelin and colicins